MSLLPRTTRSTSATSILMATISDNNNDPPQAKLLHTRSPIN